MIYVIMGVLGSGKTTVGKMLAKKLGLVFHDADEYLNHKERKNLSKGIPLSDAEWKNWMIIMRAIVDRELARGSNAVIACAALKEKYRQLLIHDKKNMKLIYLKGSPEIIEQKLKRHKNRHNASSEIVKNHFKILEEPKNADVIDMTIPAEKIVEIIMLNQPLNVNKK
jgi:gluconokinase